jgi:hypothetical protein
MKPKFSTFNFQLSIILLAGIALVGCDAIKEAASHDFTVNNVDFDFSTTVSAATRAGGNPFTLTRTVTISEIGSSDIVAHADKISKVVVSSSLFNITASPEGDYTVIGLTISAVNVPGSLVISSYTMGDAFTPPANINTYTAAFIMKLLRDKSLTVTVSGETDAPAGTTLNISYKNNLIFTAFLL